MRFKAENRYRSSAISFVSSPNIPGVNMNITPEDVRIIVLWWR